MKNKTIGVIGRGFVGGAVENGFKDYETKAFDVSKDRQKDSLNEVLNQDYVFVCVPTPMTRPNGGTTNLSILNEAMEDLSKRNSDAIFIIKSTVPVGTTEKYCNKYKNLKIVHSPEFLTAANANKDFENPDRYIVGGKQPYAKKVRDLLIERFPSTPCLTTTSNESEMIKYAANCFLATKVSFFNEIFDFCMKKNVNWDTLIEGITLDKRIGESHCQVPGPDGNKGFGGTCFPKDINSLICQIQDENMVPLLLSAAWQVNLLNRELKDWHKESSAVSKINIK